MTRRKVPRRWYLVVSSNDVAFFAGNIRMSALQDRDQRNVQELAKRVAARLCYRVIEVVEVRPVVRRGGRASAGKLAAGMSGAESTAAPGRPVRRARRKR